MNWQDIAGPLASIGAPTLGKILGGLIPIPGGAILGEWAGNAVAEALNVPATPEAVSTAIARDPNAAATAVAKVEAEASAKWQAQADIAKSQAEVGKAQVEQVNETIRAEASKPDGWWGSWRTVLAYELAIECPAWAGLIMYSVALDKAGVSDLINASGLIMAWWGARFGVLGVHVWTGSNERQVAMTGSPTSGVAGGISNLVKAVTGKR